MKVFVTVNNYGGTEDNAGGENKRGTGWYILADSAVSNTGKPFYLPDEYGKTVAYLCVAAKISRLGKSVKKKFATRYYSEYAPAVCFQLPEYAEKLRNSGLPEDPSRNFDKALIVGDFIPKEEIGELEFWLNGESRSIFKVEELLKSTDELLECISDINTLKMGDLVVPGLNGDIPLKEGDLIEIKKGRERMFHVRVK